MPYTRGIARKMPDRFLLGKRGTANEGTYMTGRNVFHFAQCCVRIGPAAHRVVDKCEADEPGGCDALPLHLGEGGRVLTAQ